MPIHVVCAVCEDEIMRPGGLLFSPPDDGNKVTKYHLCEICFAAIISDWVA